MENIDKIALDRFLEYVGLQSPTDEEILKMLGKDDTDKLLKHCFEQKLIFKKDNQFFIANQKVIANEANSPDRYFSGEKSPGKFIPELLAEDIMEKYDFITLTDNEEMFWFNEKEGLWKPKGEVLIKAIGTSLLGSETKQNYLSETIGYVKAKTYKGRDVFDNPNLNLLPVKNGVLNIETLELIPYSREYYFTSKLNVDYNPQADCPKIKKFLIEVVEPEDVDLLIEIVGYCLYRKYHIQKAVMLVGGGANGKSTYLLLICYFLGEDNVCSVSLQDL